MSNFALTRQMNDAEASPLRTLLGACAPAPTGRILCTAAGIFGGAETTREVVELFPSARVVGLEAKPDQAAALREAFGDRVETVEAEVDAYESAEPFDLVVVNGPVAAIPAVFDDLLDFRLAALTRPGGVLVSMAMTDHRLAFHGPKRLPPGSEDLLEAFMRGYLGTFRADEERWRQRFAHNPRWEVLGLADKWAGDPANFLGWLALERTDAPAAPRPGGLRRTRIGRLRSRVAQGKVTRLDLLGSREGCGRHCDVLLTFWTRWAQTSFGGTLPVERVIPRPPVALADLAGSVVVGEPLALLVRPPDVEAYHHRIGAKSRNMIRKAHRAGFEYATFDRNAWLDDLHEINVSLPERQGLPMAPGYLERPSAESPRQFCTRHGVEWLGGFRDGRLRAYIRLVRLNELAVIDQILGHGADLRDGVMNGLVDFLARHLVEDPQLRAANYLTIFGATESLARFKRSVGFEDRAVVLSALEHEAPALDE